MHPDEDAPAHVCALPVELYHQIIIFLDVKDVLALRKTCKYFLALTQERGLWSIMFTRLRATQALPCTRTEFMTMPSANVERMLFAASRVEQSFLQVRERLSHHIPAVKQPYSSMNASMCSWRVLTFISDHFILSVDVTAVIIWDTVTLASPSQAAASPWAHFTLSNFLGYVDCYSVLYFVVSRVHVDHLSAVIYSVPLPSSETSESHHGRLNLDAEFRLHETELLKHMDPPSGRALLYRPPSSIHIVHWRDGNRRSTIAIQTDELDQGWNGITSMRFCDAQTANPLPLLRHRFGPVCFRAVALSRIRMSRCPSSGGDVYTIFMLTNDVYQGMFHYRIRLTTTPVPAISVRVLAKGSIQPSEPLPLIPGTDVRYTLEHIIRRVFVSTWSMGSAGLRGVWVDRQRGSIDRRVVAFTTRPSRLRRKGPGSLPEDDYLEDESEAPTMDGKAVHVISSYDLRDDITICSVSEWTGRIALGSRMGAISLL